MFCPILINTHHSTNDILKRYFDSGDQSLATSGVATSTRGRTGLTDKNRWRKKRNQCLSAVHWTHGARCVVVASFLALSLLLPPLLLAPSSLLLADFLQMPSLLKVALFPKALRPHRCRTNSHLPGSGLAGTRSKHRKARSCGIRIGIIFSGACPHLRAPTIASNGL